MTTPTHPHVSPPPANATAAAPANTAPHPRILIAEDHAPLRKQLQQVLEAEPGVTVETTGNGQEALELLTRSARPFSLILTDLKLPGLDGMQLVEQIQKQEIPVTSIVFTAYGSIQD